MHKIYKPNIAYIHRYTLMHKMVSTMPNSLKIRSGLEPAVHRVKTQEMLSDKFQKNILLTIAFFLTLIEILATTGNLIWVTSIISQPISLCISTITISLFLIGALGLHIKNNFLSHLLLIACCVEFLMSLIFLYVIFVMPDVLILTVFHALLISVISLLGVFLSLKTISWNIRIKRIENLKFNDNLNYISNSEYSVEMINVHKVYKVGEIKVHALRGVNLKVRRGEFIAIMGPSGSGKSTLLNLIGALDKPTEGKVIIDGIDISTLNNDQLAKLRNEKIGFIFQNFNLINRSKVIRNIELPAIIKGMPKRERIKRALELLKALGLEGLHNRRPKHLSGGQQQRVAIARALINSPQIILADEPTGNLDSVSGREVMSYLRMMNERFGTTVIVVTHDREVGEMADRIVHIKDGMIIGEEIIRREKYEKNN